MTSNSAGAMIKRSVLVLLEALKANVQPYLFDLRCSVGTSLMYMSQNIASQNIASRISCKVMSKTPTLFWEIFKRALDSRTE